MKQKSKDRLYGTMRMQYKQIQELKAENARLKSIINTNVADAGRGMIVKGVNVDVRI